MRFRDRVDAGRQLGAHLAKYAGCVTAATGTAEREAALLLLHHAPHAATVGGDKGFDVSSFVANVRARGVTPHVA